MGHFHYAVSRTAKLLLTSSLLPLLMAGCSASSDSPATTEDDNVVSDTDSIATAAQPEANETSSEVSDENLVSGNDNIDETSELLAPASDSIPEETNTNELNSDTTTSVVPAPLEQNRIQVEFGITVPAYQSDALQVRLTWGDTDVTAGWVGDELWSTSLDLPTDTEHTLSVTFSDNNGEIKLASFDQSYRTGSNAAEMFNITAEQFNSEQWDADNDGSSNLEELIAGSNPNIDEDSLLEVRDSMTLTQLSNVAVSSAYEGRIPDDRPYSFTAEPPHPDFPGSDGDNINIDENGNGSIVSFYQLFAEQRQLTATRTSSGNSISWDVSGFTTDGDIRRNLNVTNTVSVVDENTRLFVENVVRRNNGTNIESWETSSNLTGEIIDESSFCKPISGSITNTYFSNFGFGGNVTTTTVKKESDQPNWRVIVSRNEIIEEEYFVRDLRISRVDTSDSDVSQEQAYFKCDFVDF